MEIMNAKLKTGEMWFDDEPGPGCEGIEYAEPAYIGTYCTYHDAAEMGIEQKDLDEMESGEGFNADTMGVTIIVLVAAHLLIKAFLSNCKALESFGKC